MTPTAKLIEASIRKLGLSPKASRSCSPATRTSITWAHARTLRMSGAQVAMMAEEVDLLQSAVRPIFIAPRFRRSISAGDGGSRLARWRLGEPWVTW